MARGPHRGPAKGMAFGAWGGHRPSPPSTARGKTPDLLKAIFTRLDKDRDGKLDFEEFSAGAKGIHQRMAEVHDAVRGWAARSLAASQAGWKAPHKADGKTQSKPDSRAMRDGPGGKAGVKKPRGEKPASTEAKIRELEAKIKALEAKFGKEVRDEGRKRRD